MIEDFNWFCHCSANIRQIRTHFTNQKIEMRFVITDYHYQTLIIVDSRNEMD
jgi:hypothetical protein